MNQEEKRIEVDGKILALQDELTLLHPEDMALDNMQFTERMVIFRMSEFKKVEKQIVSLPESESTKFWHDNLNQINDYVFSMLHYITSFSKTIDGQFKGIRRLNKGQLPVIKEKFCKSDVVKFLTRLGNKEAHNLMLNHSNSLSTRHDTGETTLHFNVQQFTKQLLFEKSDKFKKLYGDVYIGDDVMKCAERVEKSYRGRLDLFKWFELWFDKFKEFKIEFELSFKGVFTAENDEQRKRIADIHVEIYELIREKQGLVKDQK